VLLILEINYGKVVYQTKRDALELAGKKARENNKPLIILAMRMVK
jgi:hypothetical protein